MSRQSWTPVVAAATAAVLLVALALVPVPYVAWAPGRTIDLLGQGTGGRPAIAVDGIRTHPVTGELRMTTVSVTRVDADLTLGQALWAWLRPHHDVLPREVVYAPAKSADQVRRDEVLQMDTSKQDAVVAALTAAKVPVVERPLVVAVSSTGPAYGKLAAGDLVERIDQTEVTTTAQVQTLVRRHAVGDQVVFSVLRDGRKVDVTVTTVASNQDKAVPVVGVTTRPGWLYTPKVTFGIDEEVVGPSAGLVFSLAIYDRITPGDLLRGRHVAGTGGITAAGAVTPIGGIQEKIAGAEQQGATTFLVPAGNCVDLAGVHTGMQLVRVATLSEAIGALTALRDDPKAVVPHC